MSNIEIMILCRCEKGKAPPCKILAMCLLYMSRLVATRYNPLIQAQYQQLLGRGKVKKVALIACMRKFLTILNAMLRDQVPFRQTVMA
ncbi:hypothetical protein MASR2M66_10950 [Chloroflexota bacterium]